MRSGSDGPFVRALDNALASFSVERQAYYSGTLVGNHVNRCLKVHTCTHNLNTRNYLIVSNNSHQENNITTLCASVTINGPSALSFSSITSTTDS